jgi:hypothetical protein
MKRCSICGRYFPANEFSYGRRDNRSYCRQCNREEKAAYRQGYKQGCRQGGHEAGCKAGRQAAHEYREHKRWSGLFRQSEAVFK